MMGAGCFPRELELPPGPPLLELPLTAMFDAGRNFPNTTAKALPAIAADKEADAR